MHIFGVAFITAGILFALFEEQSLLIYFFATIGIYITISLLLPGARNISTRQKIMVGTWGEPTEGNIHVKLVIRPEKCLEIIKKYEGQHRLTMTHFAIKACG